ncbi:MAG: AAA family ATPase, partial [Terracidiphilus sp.]
VREHKGFVVVTGEIGTGKTLLLRCLLHLFERSKDISYAYVFNGRLTPTEFLQYILLDFGLPASGKNKSELLFDLGKFLASQNSKQMTTVLIVDEAHNLSEELLEEVRLLSNLETPGHKLLQIVLVGQPELDEKLDSIGLKSLKQRIAIRTRLDPLNKDETKTYIERRLQIAGANSTSTSLFSADAIAAVYKYSCGFPRLINTICENALITAYARHEQSITSKIIGDVAEDFRLDVPLGVLCDKLSHTHVEPLGWTGNAELGYAKSILDYIFQWIEMRFLSGDQLALFVASAVRKLEDAGGISPVGGTPPRIEHTYAPGDAPLCATCGELMLPNGICFKCANCGSTNNYSRGENMGHSAIV